MTPSEYTVTPLDNTIQPSGADSQLIGVVNPEGSLSVFELVPFVTVPDAMARRERSFGPSYLSSLQSTRTATSSSLCPQITKL